ncbi:O-methyltransferase [Sandaracinobacteroides saxicola]|uniref:O-methyltransferase n=1 Tax=Sandaracinobacteroides saxicola TaxID=2759707 RepID=A0A7G5ILM0_9SPHN|nr:O-methyltransferase [Sandaracinobacteroides saxicola]QMW24262.1 O-methyltransferase [Sandaracinobacteroides saxicola]
MAEEWDAIDRLIEERLLRQDVAVAAALANNKARGLPAIDVSRLQGRMLELLVAAVGARRVLEVGTLGGVSTIFLARGAGADGHVTTLELEPHHAAVARENLAVAGLAARVTVLEGPARSTLATLAGPFDFAFVDADKASYPAYVAACADLLRPGGLMVVDNAVRRLAISDPAAQDDNVRGTFAAYDVVAADARLDATAIQTVGMKGWDGFMLVRRR